MDISLSYLIYYLALLNLAYYIAKAGLAANYQEKLRLLAKIFISVFWMEFVCPFLYYLVAWLPFRSLFYLIFLLITLYIMSPQSEGDQAMHKVCSTLLTSTEEVYKAVRRRVSYRIASIFMWVASRLIKHTAKYFTKDELENLRKDTDELNAAMTKAYRKFAGFSLTSPESAKIQTRKTFNTGHTLMSKEARAPVTKMKTVNQKGFNP
eukprot:TRINITY_DN918_c0_g2_i2.p1 TRINITY_DN918_c0_g2~~TRINITY_DN918_c0_g2_i2.p1  ORF type:complete len:240 (-),score=54.98 TRINITY_DN918_c0_g2_i2:71-694(-)